jgi:hypothetical protein
MSKQTAVEWLEDQIFASTKFIDIDLFQVIEQAKEMEREQIHAAHNDGYSCGIYQEGCQFEYYNETYGGDK